MKTIRIFTAMAALCLLLSACAKRGYSSEYSCLELCRFATESLGEDYSEYGEEHLRYTFDSDDHRAKDQCVLYSDDVRDIGEIGVFLADSTSEARIIAEECEDYLEELYEEQRAFISSYAPSELTKLQNASVRRYGNYVIYAVADDVDTVFSKIERRLTR